MKAYILRIVGAALIAAFSEHLVPKEWQKYMKLISGFIIISVLIAPFTGEKTKTLFDDFDISWEYKEKGEELMLENIKAQLEEDIAKDIALRVTEEFSREVTAKVWVDTDSRGKIKGVRRIELSGEENSEITKRLEFVYGTDEVIWL